MSFRTCLITAVLAGIIGCAVSDTARAADAREVSVDLAYGGNVVKANGEPLVLVDRSQEYHITFSKDGLVITPAEPKIQAKFVTLTFLDGVPFEDAENHYDVSATITSPSGESRGLFASANTAHCFAVEDDLPIECGAEAAKSPNGIVTRLATLTLGWNLFIKPIGRYRLSLEIINHVPGTADGESLMGGFLVLASMESGSRAYATLAKSIGSAKLMTVTNSNTLQRISGYGVAQFTTEARLVATISQDTADVESLFTKTLKGLPLNNLQKMQIKCLSCTSPQADEQSVADFHLPKPSVILSTDALAGSGSDFLPFDWANIKNLDGGVLFSDEDRPLHFGIAVLKNTMIDDGIAALSYAWGSGNFNQITFSNIVTNHVGAALPHGEQTALSVALGSEDRLPETVDKVYRQINRSMFGKYVVSNQFAGADAFLGLRVSGRAVTAPRHVIDSNLVVAYRSTGIGYTPPDGTITELTGVSGPLFEASLKFAHNFEMQPQFGVEFSGYRLANDNSQQRVSNLSEKVDIGLKNRLSVEYFGSHGHITAGLIAQNIPRSDNFIKNDDQFLLGYDDSTDHFKIGAERSVFPSCISIVAIPPSTMCAPGTPYWHLAFEASRSSKHFSFGIRYGGNFAYRRDNGPSSLPVQQLLYAGYRFGDCSGAYVSLNKGVKQGLLQGPNSATDAIIELNDDPFRRLGTVYIGYMNETSIAAPGGTLPLGTAARDRAFYLRLRLGTAKYKSFCDR